MVWTVLGLAAMFMFGAGLASDHKQRQIRNLRREHLAQVLYFAKNHKELEDLARRIQRNLDMGWTLEDQVGPSQREVEFGQTTFP